MTTRRETNITRPGAREEKVGKDAKTRRSTRGSRHCSSPVASPFGPAARVRAHVCVSTRACVSELRPRSSRFDVARVCAGNLPLEWSRGFIFFIIFNFFILRSSLPLLLEGSRPKNPRGTSAKARGHTRSPPIELRQANCRSSTESDSNQNGHKKQLTRVNGQFQN